jgi:hypothetical protein
MDANAFMSGKIDSLSFGASLELKAFVIGRQDSMK